MSFYPIGWVIHCSYVENFAAVRYVSFIVQIKDDHSNESIFFRGVIYLQWFSKTCYQAIKNRNESADKAVRFIGK